MRGRRVSVVVWAFVLFVGGVIVANTTAPPDSRVNPATGIIETADATWTGAHFAVRHVINPGGGQPLQVSILTNGSQDDLSPKIAISATTGDTWVVWWRDLTIDQVVARKRTNATGSWSSERVQSTSSVGSRNPYVAFDGTQPWVAFEQDAAGGGTNVAVKMIEDDPVPFVTAAVVGTTAYSGSLDTQIRSESGHLWVTWIDGTTNVGWVRYDYATKTWSIPSYESYVADSVDAARGRIRTDVLAY